MKDAFFQFILFLALLGGGTYYLVTHQTEKEEYGVVLTEDGFSPVEITIEKGESIIFSSNRGLPFWPASNLHPTHDEYPAFDPKKPIEAEEKWEFTFDRVGEWRYHDHLSPNYRARIIVTEEK